MKTISQILSTLFHPSFVPIIGFYLMHLLGGYATYLPPVLFGFTVFSIVLFTIIFPLISVILLKKLGKVSSIQLDKREERPLPLIISLISVCVLLIVEKRFFYPAIYDAFFASIALNYCVSFFASLDKKISLHAIGWGTLIGIFIGLSTRLGIALHFWVALLIMLTSLILSARLFLRAHTLSEVLSGWIISILLSWMAMLTF